MLILFFCAILLAALAIGLFFLLLVAVIASALAVGGWLLAMLAGIHIAGAQEKREQILLASIGILLAIMVVALTFVW